ncbi:MAG: glycosyl hydrolase [Patescibacteria group bacterium]|nr:glycosyl hydrolase [Patescibacteria group bacterium]
MKKYIFLLLLLFALSKVEGLFLPKPVLGASIYENYPQLRFGASFNSQLTLSNGQKVQAQDYLPWKNLGVTWYMDWSYTGGARDGLDYVALVGAYSSGAYTAAKCNTLKQTITAHPERYQPEHVVFAVGNEIMYQPQSCPFTPETYPAQYKAWYDCVKSINPNYRVSPGAIVGTKEYFKQFGKRNEELYRQMLTNYRNKYGINMPIDVFVTHTYLLGWTNEADVNFFKEEVKAQRKLMKDFGWQDKEMWISEYTVLSPSDEVTMKRFMEGTINYIMSNEQINTNLGNPNDGNRMVQRFAWFILTDVVSGYRHTLLADLDTAAITPLGSKYQSLVQKYGLGLPTPSSTSSCSCPSGIPSKLSGNANCDSVVDRADLNYWLNQFVSGVVQSQYSADFNCDSKVDRQDLGYWINGFTR